MALAVLGTYLGQLHLQCPPGLWSGAAGGLAYALAEFLADYREGFPDDRPGGLYLVQVVVRVILGAVVGAATLALGQAQDSWPVSLGRRRWSPWGEVRSPQASARREGGIDANDRPNTESRT